VILTIKLSGIAKVKGIELKMSPLEKRIQNLKSFKELEEKSAKPNQNYIDDLNLSIKRLELELKNVSKDGYRMVKV
jgi:hypothetical protein